MSFYSSIDRRINADKWFRDLSHMGQLLWFRLLTGPHVTPVAGLWPATEDGLARAFKMSIGLFRKTYRELAGAQDKPTGKVHADWDAGVIWFPKAIHVPANQPKNENVLRGWMKHLELVPECGLRDRGVTEIVEWVNSSGKRFPYGLPAGFPKPLLKQFGEQSGGHSPRAQQEQEQDQEQEQEKRTAAASVGSLDLDREIILPLDFQLHPSAVADLASWSGFSEAVVLEAVQEFKAYWTIGGGAGKRRAHWQSRCRDDVKRKKEQGKLAAIAQRLGESGGAQTDETGGYGDAEDWLNESARA